MQGNEFPTGQSILDGSLSRHSEEPVTAFWRQGKDKILGECELAGAKNTCHLELDRVDIDTKQPVSLCLPNGHCTSLVFPNVKFTGELNYQGKVTAHLSKEFSDDISTAWLLSSAPDNAIAQQEHQALNVSPQALTVKLQSNDWGIDAYIHQYLFFCITDHGKGWQQYCFSVGEQANKIRQFKDLVIYDADDKQKELVGGGVYDISEPTSNITRSIAPVPFLKSHLNINIYRPLTLSELYLIKTEINKPKTQGYPLLEYNNDFGYEEYGDYYVYNNAFLLCNHITGYSLSMPETKDLTKIDKAAWLESGWPKGAYWSRKVADGKAYNIASYALTTPKTALTACKIE
ncbi:hypothetical protein NFHSH190041_17560 [Shewanella sp. NFH-SH190041]|nr:hypothetical protein NFHSH190041_17560 [Shewanella sp. NFH-SH190041]